MRKRVKVVDFGKADATCVPGGDSLAGLVTFELWQARQHGCDSEELS